MLRFPVAILALVAAACADMGNMNGGYELSATPNGRADLFPTNYSDYPGDVFSFDVLSPVISTLCKSSAADSSATRELSHTRTRRTPPARADSQVFWDGLDPVDLPADIVERFDGKGMAIVGFELDQVYELPNGEYASLPMTVAYVRPGRLRFRVPPLRERRSTSARVCVLTTP